MKYKSVELARNLITRKFKDGQHHVACVIVTRTGVYEALHLDSDGHDVCAEPVALSRIAMDNIPKEDIMELCCVAWGGNENNIPRVIPPCGNCRQLLHEYSPEIEVIIENNKKELSSIAIKELLPHPYKKID